jgi:cobalamin biosynthetic protein CobC
MLEHGGNLEQAISRFGGLRKDWLDLSTGINPIGYPTFSVESNAWHHLPEIDPQLLQAACTFYDVTTLLPVAGTQAAIQSLPRCRTQSRVVIASPSYAEHAHQWRRNGHAVREVSFSLLDNMVGDCDVLVVCNPNNPTGEIVQPDQLLRWASQLAKRGGWLIVDQAFADIDPSISVAAWSHQPGLIVLHSVGKFFGLAGLRLGFVSAEPGLLSVLADFLGPWTISQPAQALGLKALEDKTWQTRARTDLIENGHRLESLLHQHLISCRGCSLFQWWPEATPEEFWLHMAKRQIWVRLFANAARGIRLGLPENGVAWQRLEAALNEWNKRGEQ